MLNPSEKAYTLALLALKRKDYRVAIGYFERAAPHFETNKEFNLLRDTTRLLVEVKEKLSALEIAEDRLEVEEVFSNGQEKDVL